MANSPIMMNPKSIPQEGLRLDKNASASTNALGLVGTTNKVFGLGAGTTLLDLSDTKITGFATPTADTDGANKKYVDDALLGLKWKYSVRVATDAAGTLISSFENGDTVDGVVLATNDRILIKNQAAPAENGIYTVNPSGQPTRSTDADAWTELVSAAVFVEEGTANADTAWTCTSNAGGTLGTTAVTFAKFSSSTAITATAASGGGTLGVITVNTDTAGLDITAGSLFVKLETVNPTLQITGTPGLLGLKIGDTSLVALAAGVKASLPKKTEYTVAGFTSGNLDITVSTIATGYQTTDRVRLEVIGGPVLEATYYTIPAATTVRIPNAETLGIANGDKLAVTYMALAT